MITRRAASMGAAASFAAAAHSPAAAADTIELPTPRRTGGRPLMEAGFNANCACLSLLMMRHRAIFSSNVHVGYGAADRVWAVKFLGIVAAVCLFLLSGCHAPQLSAAAGQELADRWCSDCHGRSGPHPGHFNTLPVETPTFAQIAAYPQVNRQFLEKFLNSIIVMPMYQLSDEEKEEVIDYILSLKPRKQAAQLDQQFE